MINKSVLFIGFGLATAKSRQDESIFLYPYFSQSVDKCEYVGERKDLLKDHVKVKHIRIKCEQCDYHSKGKVNNI